MQIGAVAEKLGISSSSIRYYERRGLIKPVGRVAGRREFDQQSIMTLKFLKLAQAAGFTLDESQILLKMGFGEKRQNDDWVDFLTQKRKSLQIRAKELKRMDFMLEQFETCTCPSLAECMHDGGET